MKTVVIAVLLTLAAAARADGTTVPIDSKSALVVPAPFALVRELPLPPNLVRASMFGRPDGAHLLVTVAKPDPRPCAARLDEAMAQTRQAMKDPAAAQLYRFSLLELRTMGRHKAVYSEGQTRSPAVARAGGAFTSIGSASFCVASATVGLTLSLPPGATSVGERDRAMLAALVTSLPE